jgi:hypothetical protein
MPAAGIFSHGSSKMDINYINSIRQAVRRQPFRPFAMCLADGRAIEIRHPECIAMNQRIVIVVDDDSFTQTLEPLSVVSLEELKQPPKGGNGSEGKKRKR